MFSPSKRRPLATIKHDQQQPHYVPQALVQERGMHLHTASPRWWSAASATAASVSAPKASRLMKLPQRPMACPISKPHHASGRSCAPSLKLRFLLGARSAPPELPTITRAVDGQPAVPDSHGLRPVKGAVRILEQVQIKQHIVQPRAHDSTGECPTARRPSSCPR